MLPGHLRPVVDIVGVVSLLATIVGFYLSGSVAVLVLTLVVVFGWLALRYAGTGPLVVHVWLEPALVGRTRRLAPDLTVGLRVDALHRDKPGDVRLRLKQRQWGRHQEAYRDERQLALLREPAIPLGDSVAAADSVWVARVILYNRSNGTVAAEDVGRIRLIIHRPEMHVLGWRRDAFKEPGLQRPLRSPLPDTRRGHLGNGDYVQRGVRDSESPTEVTLRLKRSIAGRDSVRDDLTVLGFGNPPKVEVWADALRGVPVVKPYPPAVSRMEQVRQPLRTLKRRASARRARPLRSTAHVGDLHTM